MNTSEMCKELQAQGSDIHTFAVVAIMPKALNVS